MRPWVSLLVVVVAVAPAAGEGAPAGAAGATATTTTRSDTHGRIALRVPRAAKRKTMPV